MPGFEGIIEMIDTGSVYRIIQIQVVITVTITLIMLLFQSMSSAMSAFVGGAIGFLTSLIYAKKMQAPPGSEPRAILRAHYKAEAYKMVFTILLFSLVFTQLKEINALPMFAAYAATVAAYWLALLK